MIKLYISIFTIFLLLSGCNEKKDITNKTKSLTIENNIKSKKTEPVKIAEIKRPKAEEDFLMIIDYIPLNSNYNFIKQIFPEIYNPNYYERKKNSKYLDTKIFNKKVKIEFVLSQDMKLYRIVFRMRQLDYAEADSLYNKLKKYYHERYGNYKEEISDLSEDSDYPFPILHYSSWKLSDFDINVGLNESHMDCSIVWEYRKNQ